MMSMVEEEYVEMTLQDTYGQYTIFGYRLPPRGDGIACQIEAKRQGVVEEPCRQLLVFISGSMFATNFPWDRPPEEVIWARGLALVHGLLDFGLFDKSKVYRWTIATSGEKFDPPLELAAPELDDSEQQLVYHILCALRRTRREIPREYLHKALDPAGACAILGIDGTLFDHLVDRLSEEGWIVPTQPTAKLFDGEFYITKAGIRALEEMEHREKTKWQVQRVVEEVQKQIPDVAAQPTASIQPALPPSPLDSPSSSAPNHRPNRILIVTVTKTEAQAVLETFFPAGEKGWRRQIIGGSIYYNLGMHGGVPVFMVQSEAGSVTPGGALLTVRQAIQDLRPQAVIMCGIAFGLHPDRQQLGDILVAKQLQCYEPQKVGLRRGQTPRGDRVTSAERLLARFRSGDNDWKGASTHFGLVLSGEKLVNNPAFRDRLLQNEPEAIGGEMEGAGLYAAARDAKVDWILVKAICDWADGKKSDDAQPLAARNAAQFVLHVLRLGGWGGPG